MAITVYIGGDLVLPSIDSLVIDYILNGRTTASFSLFDGHGSYNPAVGSDVAVLDGDTKIYGGSIDQNTRKLLKPCSASLRHEILSVGFERWLDKRLTYDVQTNRILVYNSYEGMADASNTTLSWVSGDYFDSELTGRSVSVGGNARTILSVESPISLTLGEVGGAGSDIAWSSGWTAGAIVQDLIARFGAEEGITEGSIDTGATVSQLICNYLLVDDALDQLAQLSGFVGWTDSEKKQNFVARDTVAAPFDIGDTSKILDITVRDTREDYRNTEAIRASFVAFGVTETAIVGDGAIRAWQLTNYIASIETADVNGVPVTFGIQGVDSGKDFYFRVGHRIVQQDPVGAAMEATDTLTIRWKELGTDVVVSTDDAEVVARADIESGTSGRYQHFTDDSNNPSATAVLEKGDSLVARYKVMPRQIKYKTCAALEPLAPQLRPGQFQNIKISKLGVDAAYLISQVHCYSANRLSDGSGDYVLWYEITAVNGTYLNNFLTAFESFVGPWGRSSPIAASGGALVEVDRATFGVGIGAPQAIGADLTNHFMVRQPDKGGTFIEALANCKTPEGGALFPLIFDILKSTDHGASWITVFGETKLVIPVDTTTQVHQLVFAADPDNAVKPDDWLRVDLMDGSNEGSEDIEIVIRWGKIPGA